MDDLSWHSGNYPVSPHFGDGYFSRPHNQFDGRGETRSVFLGGNGLPGRWQTAAAFTIGELGFGTGLNFFETCHCWCNTQKPPTAMLTYVSFELYPISLSDIKRALSSWPDLARFISQITNAWPPAPGWHRFIVEGITLKLAIGEASHMLPHWSGAADAWYLDGFSPAKNPALWTPEILKNVYQKTTLGGSFSTYTSAGDVRRGLEAAGFITKKVAGYGKKRHRLQGTTPAPPNLHCS